MNKIANTDYEIILIQTLRQEAQTLKGWFERFSFQAAGVSLAAVGIMLRYPLGQPSVAGFVITTAVSIGVIFLLVAVTMIGTRKYMAVNRLCGYELYLFQTRHLKDSLGDGWKSSMRAINWEEAMRAWRIIHPAISRHLYYSSRIRPMYLRSEHRHRPRPEKKWFDLKELTVAPAVYDAGGYLRYVQEMLYVFALLCTSPLIIMTFQLHALDTQIWKLAVAVILVVVLSIIWRYMKDTARRKALETGLLSIHSYAIMWQAVVVAHYRAINSAKQEGDAGKYYIKHLSRQTKDLVSNIFEIYEWMQGTQKNTGSCQVESPVPN